jgi:hypothetical protein
LDRRISETFTIGGTGVHLHKYLGTNPAYQSYQTTSNTTANTNTISFANTAIFSVGQTVTGAGINANTVVFATNTTANTITISSNTISTIPSGSSINVYWKDTTIPLYNNQSALNIQDLLFLENRDRKYDENIYIMRGIYSVSDNDFDLKQFGLFLSPENVYMFFHINDMVQMIGRKIMAGDVVELPHRKDYFPLNEDIPAVLKRFYVVQDATYAADGFSPTWWPHLWRIKMSPMVDSQEYKDILNNIKASDNTDVPLANVMSNFGKLIEINDAILRQASIDVPLSGTATDSLYVEPINPDGSPGDPTGRKVDYTLETADSLTSYSDANATTPDTNVPAYLGGDGTPPNGWPVSAGSSFPSNPNIGNYFLRTDFVPNRLFRYDGIRWTKIEDAVRTDLTPGPNNKTQRSIFINDNSTYTTMEGQTFPSRQALNTALTPKADN